MIRGRLLTALLLLLGIGPALAGSGYTVNGVDLDSIFAPYHSGWPQAAATGYKVGNADINTRYAKLSSGSSAAATGFKISGGADLNTVFAALGSTNVQVATQPSSVSGSAAAGNPSGSVTSSSTSTAGAKGGGSYTYTWHIASGSASFTSGSSASTAVTNSSVPAGTTLSGTMYCTISDGVTSANANTVSWSLQNTTPAYLYNGTVTSGEIQTGSGSTEIRQIGWSIAVISGGTVMGSISPSADINGNAIGAVYSSETGYPVPSSYGMLLVIAGNRPQNYFTTLTVNGQAFSSSSASYSYSSGYTYWNWSDGSMVFAASGQNYSVTIQ